MKYDVIVVGAGPAGATFARCAAKNLKILLLDGAKRRFGDFGKPCGGLLAPDAQKALLRFGLTLPDSVLVAPQIFEVKTIDVKSGIIRNYPREYLNMDRRRFDLWLLSLVGNNTMVLSADCTGISKTGDGFSVAYRDADGDHTAESVYLVGADGAHSSVRKYIYPDARPRMYTSIQQWFDCKEITPFYSCIFDPEATDCCSWSICKDGKLIFGGAYPADNCCRRFEDEKRRLVKFGFEFGKPERTEACLVLRPKSPRDFFCGRNGAFLIGEAAGFLSPSSLEGISWAMRSGAALASALSEDEPERAYVRKTAGLRFRLTAKMLKCPFMYVPFLRRLAMKSGFGSTCFSLKRKTGKRNFD